MPTHLTHQELESFLGSGVRTDPALSRKVVEHLLTGCPACKQRISLLGRGAFKRTVEPEAPVEVLRRTGGQHESVLEDNYERAFSRAEHMLSLFLSEGTPRQEPPGAILAELFPGPLDGAPSVNENRFAIPALIKWLTKRSHRVRYADPEEMLHWGLMARLAADACSREVAGSERRLADLRVRAWGQFSNSLRVCGRISESEEAFAAAQRYAELGTGDLMLRARLGEQITSLCIFQRRFEDALEIAGEATQIYRELGARRQFARASVQAAIIFLYSGDANRAARNLQLAIPFIDLKKDPHLTLAARHNLVRCYVDLNRPDLAKSVYSQAQMFYRGLTDEILLLRATWQEGHLLHSLGQLRDAKTALLRARKGFLERGLAFEVAVVTHDLARVLRQMGELQALEEVVLETSARFEHMHPSAEALASLQELRQTVFRS